MGIVDARIFIFLLSLSNVSAIAAVFKYQHAAWPGNSNIIKSCSSRGKASPRANHQNS